jgi:uncharacterized membrane protein
LVLVLVVLVLVVVVVVVVVVGVMKEEQADRMKTKHTQEEKVTSLTS